MEDPFFLFGFSDASQGERRCLSNMISAPFAAEDGTSFKHVEQYMHYHKAKVFGDEFIAAEILAEIDPKAIQKLGRKVSNFDKSIWSTRAENIVEEGCFYKF